MFKEWKFWNNKVVIDHGFKINNQPSPCWVWNGATDKDGYGVSSFEGKSIRAHRLALNLKNPTIYSALKALHKCNIKSCINPDHLYWGDTSQNAIDSVQAGTHYYASKTHCKHGHELNDSNTRYHTSKKGKYQRICLTCEKIRNDRRIYVSNGVYITPRKV